MSTLRLPGGLELPIEKPTVDTADEMTEHVGRCMKSRQKHLAVFAAAFLKEVGSDKASEYELVEDWSERGKLKWYFRKRASGLNNLSDLKI